MEGAPVRSRTSLTPSPSHSTASASASASSSAHYKRSSATNPKFPPPPSTDPPTAKPSFDDDDDDEDTEEPFEEEDEDDTEEPFDEDEDADMDDDDDDASAAPAPAPAPAVNAKDSTSMRTFTAARFDHLKNGGGSSSGGGAKPPKNEVKAEAGPATGAAVGGQQQPAGVAVAPQQQLNIPGIVVKDDPSKGIFTENIQTSGAYSTREEGLKREEDAGRLKFMCCANDGIDEHMIWLIGLKNIFARQLPNMPKEYIVRLVMDSGNFWKKYLLSAYYYRSLVKRLSVSQEQEEEEIVYFIIAGSHKSMMVIRHNLVVGGITYRPYISQRFGEIAFCAITADEQVKGYGTRLMNHLKQHARDVDGLTHFLTYADNNAVGYFIKQGFTKEITLEKERWHGYIKDYDGGILMECKINPKLPYTDLSTMIRRQRQAIDEKIRELSNCHIVYPGIDFQKVLVSERAQTVDIMRYVLSYACNLLLSSSDRISDIDTVLVEESVRSLLAEFVNITSFQVPKFTGTTSRQVPSGHEQFSRSPKQDIEMKKGDWICPKCSFMNFARNTRCLECEEARPKKQLTGREWECPQCEFHNYGKNMSCLRCDCKRPGEISSGANTDKSEIEPKLAANDDKAERWFGKVSQLGNSADMTSSVADEDFPEIMPMRKGVNRFVVSTRKTPLERRLAANSQSGVLGGTGSDTQPSESSINRSLDRILGRSSTAPITGEAADRGAESRLRETILSKTDPGYVPFVPLPSDMFKKPQNSTNDVQHKDDTVPTKDDSPIDFLTKSSTNSIGDENNNGSLGSDLTSAVPDEDFPEIMPIRKGENRFVVSKKKDRSLTSPQYKRRLAMEQSNKTDFVPFVPFPPDYFAKKDKQPEVAPVHTEKAVSESSSAPKKFESAPERLQNNLGASSWAPMGNQPQQHESMSYRQHESNPYNQSTNAQFSESNLNDRRVDNSSGIARTGSAFNSERGSYAPQTESSQNTRQSWNQQSFSGKSLEGSAVTEPDPLDMSEEAKAARWFRRAAQIKDISELSAIPDEDFPEIMPMRKGVNRFVVSKRKTPLERRLTSPQYRRNLPIVSSEPDKGAS